MPASWASAACPGGQALAQRDLGRLRWPCHPAIVPYPPGWPCDQLSVGQPRLQPGPEPPRGQFGILLQQIAGSRMQCGCQDVYVVRHTMIMGTLVSCPQLIPWHWSSRSGASIADQYQCALSFLYRPLWRSKSLPPRPGPPLDAGLRRRNLAPFRGCRSVLGSDGSSVRVYLVAAGLLIASRACDDHGAEVSEDSRHRM